MITLFAVSILIASAELPRVPNDTGEAELIRRAEAEGARFPRLAPPVVMPKVFSTRGDPLDHTSLAVFSRGVTSGHENEGAERKCVAGRDMGPVRSGEFTIGGNLGGASATRAGRPGKVWWAPLHQAENMPPLLIRGRNLTSAGDSLRLTLKDVAWSTPKVGAPAGSAKEYFFPSGLLVPHSGRWLLIATSGANWGCFILTVM